MTKVWMWKILMIGVVGVFAISALAESNGRAEGKQCSQRTLSGDYGFLIEGAFGNFPLRTVSMAHFDGQGNVTSLDHVEVDGLPPHDDWRPAVWTYIVTPDCRGTGSVLTEPGAPPLNFHFVIVKRGTEFHGVVDGSTIAMHGYRVD
jgi:hypothetical protein